MINLAGAVFPQEAYFEGQVFTKEVTFTGARFTTGGLFWNSQFGGGAHFWNASFGGLADFSVASFGGGAFFGGTQFRRGAFFGDAQFGGEADFGNAQFGGEANFGNASFGGGAYFGNAQFGGGADFGGAQFGRRASFSSAVIKGLLSFVGRETFPPRSREAAAEFHKLEPGSAHWLRFQDVDLSRVSFPNTDVSQVRFVGCTWAQKSQPLLWPLPVPRPQQERLVIYEELRLDQEKEKREDVRADFPLIAEGYRQLRLNYEASRQEVEAGHFYIGQMEMRRQDPSYPRPYRWMLGAYRVLAMYGESYLRPPFFYFIFGAGFALAYLWGGFQVGQAQVKYDPGSFAWGQAGAFFKDSVRAYVQALTAGGLVGTNLAGLSGANLESAPSWVSVVRYGNMLLDTFLVGFFVIALRRHFHR
jgi:hypothetical protein